MMFDVLYFQSYNSPDQDLVYEKTPAPFSQRSKPFQYATGLWRRRHWLLSFPWFCLTDLQISEGVVDKA